MPLKFKGAWRFKPPSDGALVNEQVPAAAVSDVMDLWGWGRVGPRQLVEMMKYWFKMGPILGLRVLFLPSKWGF
jgi:hypothetical protein